MSDIDPVTYSFVRRTQVLNATVLEGFIEGEVSSLSASDLQTDVLIFSGSAGIYTALFFYTLKMFCKSLKPNLLFFKGANAISGPPV